MTMGKGLAGVGASLVIIGLAMKLMPKSMILTGAGLVVVAAGLNLIAKAIATMGEMSMGEIAKGLDYSCWFSDHSRCCDERHVGNASWRCFTDCCRGRNISSCRSTRQNGRNVLGRDHQEPRNCLRQLLPLLE